MTTNQQKLFRIDDKGRKLGMVLDMPETEYHAIKAFSYSGSKEFSRSPEHYQEYLKKEWEIDPKREKYKAVHLLCLEPELQSKIVVVDGRWAGKVKEEVLAHKKEGKLVLKQDDLDDAKNIAARMKAHGLAGTILANSFSEVTLLWLEGEVYCKARIDILSITEMGICIGDLKNFGNLADERLLGVQIAKQKYHHQAGWYSRGVEQVFGKTPIKRYWIFVEEEAPYGIKVRNCPDAGAEAGWESISSLLPEYANCLASDLWPSYSQEEEDAQLPAYIFDEVSYE